MAAVLNYIFNISILIGFVIPLLNLLTGWFGGFFDVGVDMDFDLDVDVDLGIDVSADVSTDAGVDTSVGTSALIPFNVMCLCMFLVVFGAFGHMFKRFMTVPLFTVLLLAGCLVLACLAYWGLYKLLIKRLKHSDASALSLSDLRGKSAEVTLRIMADTVGTISLRDSIGAPISFRAKMDTDLKDQMPEVIQKGESVIITDVDMDNKLCYVSVPFKKFTNKVE